jgi:hypothetical protein
MEAIGTGDRVAPIARSPLDSARGRRKHRPAHVAIISSPINSNKSEWECLPSPPSMR